MTNFVDFFLSSSSSWVSGKDTFKLLASNIEPTKHTGEHVTTHKMIAHASNPVSIELYPKRCYATLNF